MKRETALLLLSIFSIIVSCDPPVTFSEPQPEGSENETSISKKLQGYYLSREDSSGLLISDYGIFRKYEGDLPLDLKQSDSSYVWDSDSLLDINTGLHYPAVQQGDSIFAHVVMYDTLFMLGESGVFRKFKGHFFLNSKYEDSGWEVSKLRLEHGVLTIGRVREESELRLLKEISSSARDTVSPYRFSLGRRAFKKFLKEKGFREEEVFDRQSGSGAL